MLKLIIFDCDGVLVDSENLANQTLVECLSTFGIHLSLVGALKQFKGRKVKDCLDEVAGLHRVALPETFESEYRQKLDRIFEKNLKTVEGIEEALGRISLKKCVASNGPLEKTKRSLELTGLGWHFGDSVFSAYTIQKWKPDPDLFLHACREMGASPEECVVVEDSDLGVQAALRAGMRVIHYVEPENTPTGWSDVYARAPEGMQTRYFPLPGMRALPDLIQSL